MRAYGVAIRILSSGAVTITNTTPKNAGLKVAAGFGWRDHQAGEGGDDGGRDELLVALWRLLLLRPVFPFEWLLPDGDGVYLLGRSQTSMDFGGRLSRRDGCTPTARAPDEPVGYDPPTGRHRAAAESR
jgi:hypothetical protein